MGGKRACSWASVKRSDSTEGRRAVTTPADPKMG